MSSTAEPKSASQEHAAPQREPLSASLGSQPASEPGSSLLNHIVSPPPGEPPSEGTARFLSSSAFSHTANRPVRALALKHAQQTHGNRVAQRTVAQVQRKAHTGATNHHEPVQAQANGAAKSDLTKSGNGSPVPPDSPGNPLDQRLRGAMEQRFGVDFSEVRIHTDRAAETSAEALNASAFTTGRDIYFGRGKYAPETTAGQHLLAHELVHTVQQSAASPSLSPDEAVSSPGEPLEQEADRAADAIMAGAPAPAISHDRTVIARNVLPPPPSPDSANAAKTTGITAQEWVAKHATNLIGKLGYELSLADVVLTTPFVSWAPGKQRPFLTDFWQPFWTGQGNAWALLTATLAPEKPESAVDFGRDTYPGSTGTDEWRDAVVGEFYKRYMTRLRESLARVVPRWRAVKNQLALRAESGDKGAEREPAPNEVFGSHPLDTYVIRALSDKLTIDVEGYRKAFPEVAVQHQIKTGLRPVVFEFQWEAGASKWLRVTSPVDATPEEVAKTLFGSETKAYLLTSAPPLFGVEDRDLTPELQKRYFQELIKSRTAPTRVSGLQDNTPANQILAGPLADEAALLQAKKVKTNPTATPGTVLDRMRVIVRTIDRVGAAMKKIDMGGTPVSADAMHLVRERVDQRSAKLAAASPAEVVEWDPQSRGQLEIVNAAENGITMAGMQREAFKGWPSIKNVIYSIAAAYGQAVESSELVETGRQQLNIADEKSRLFPIELMEILLEELRHTLKSVHQEKTGLTAQEQHEQQYDIPKMEAREKKLREALVKVRDLVLQHPEQAKAALEPLFKEIEDLQVEVTLVVNLDQCDAAWRALYDSLSFTGEIRALWGGGNDILSGAMKDANRLNLEWHEIYLEYKFRDKEKAKKQLQEKADSAEWAGFMERIRQIITDHQTYDKWMTFALMIGIAILTAGIGAYVEAAAGAAWGAYAGFAVSVVAEAATFTTLSYALVAKDPSISGFFNEFKSNLLMFGALKIISRIYRFAVGVEAAVTAEGKAGELLVQFVAINGHALYEADQEKRKKTGQGLTAGEIGEISLTNLAFMAAVMIAGKPWVTKMQLRGEMKGEFIKIERTHSQLLDLAEAVKGQHGKDPALARKMLNKQAELLALEEKALSRLEQIATDPKAAKAAGLTSKEIENITAARGEFTDALAQVQQAQIAMHLEAVGPNELLCPAGSFFDGLKPFFEGQGGRVNDQFAPDPVTKARTMEVTPKEGTPFRVTERISATGEVGRAAEMLPEGEPSGGRYGMTEDWDVIMNDPNPTPEVRAIRDQVIKDLTAKGDLYKLKSYSMMRTIMKIEMAKLRLALIARRAAEVPRVAQVMREFGIRSATNKMIDKVFRYNFDSSGLMFAYENYAAWSRLASGKGTISDVRYLIHEMAELKEFEATGFEYMGKGQEVGTPEHMQWYETQFEPKYLAAHSKALFAEYRFLAEQMSKATGGKLNLSPEETAAIDPVNSEPLEYMMIPEKGGGEHAVGKDAMFPEWQKGATEPVQLSAAEAKRLGLPETTTRAELLRAIREAPITPAATTTGGPGTGGTTSVSPPAKDVTPGSGSKSGPTGQKAATPSPTPYTTLATNAEGGVFSPKEMTEVAVAAHPNLSGLQKSLGPVNATLVAEPALTGDADIAYIRVVGPDGKSFTRALISYHPDRAKLSHLRHELNHLLDFQSGRVPPTHELVTKDSNLFQQLSKADTASVLQTVRTLGRSAASAPITETAQFQARMAVAEIRNTLRDIEEYAVRREAGRVKVAPGMETFFEENVRIIRRWQTYLKGMVGEGRLRGRSDLLSEVERRAMEDYIRNYVKEYFPELPDVFTDLHGGGFWGSINVPERAAGGGGSGTTGTPSGGASGGLSPTQSVPPNPDQPSGPSDQKAGPPQRVLVVGAETETEFAYATDLAKQGQQVTVVNPTATPHAQAFSQQGGNFVQSTVEKLPPGETFNLIREDFPFPLGRAFSPTAQFVDARLARLAPGGRWVVVTESSEFVTTLKAAVYGKKVALTEYEVPLHHEGLPQSSWPRENKRFVLIFELQR